MPENQFDLSRLKIPREESRGASPAAKSHRAVILYGAGAVFLILSAFFFYKNYLDAEELVEVATVTMISSGQASSLLTASGYVVAQQKAAIASKATGRLIELRFKEGDRVRKGEIIARIESGDVDAALSQARADLDVARAELDDARNSWERAKNLFARQLISQADYDAAKFRYDRVVAVISSREANLKAATVAVENTLIRAPFDGTILTKNADVGEVVAPFAAGASSRVAVVTLADMNSLEVEADVSESNIQSVSLEQPCEISLDAYPDSHYRGVVDKVVPTADRAKATVMTKIRFLERDNRVIPEMGAKVHFLPKNDTTRIDDRPKVAIDPNAIATRNGKKVVFILREGRVSERSIITGPPVGSMLEITSGVSPGDRVVLRPSDQLENGANVKIKQ